jgi:FKBP-type peptidyl-prolyl cis-trans isomerase FkpA
MMHPRSARSALAILLALPAFSLSACGSDSSTGVTTTLAPTIEATTFAPALGVDLAASTKVTSGTTYMYYRDIVKGSGPAVTTGQSVSVHYTGWLSNGTQFDANIPSATPLPFQVGAGAVILGWDVGVVGMQLGGQRQLIIPPLLGYGSSDYNPNPGVAITIPGNSILVFNVTLAGVK